MKRRWLRRLLAAAVLLWAGTAFWSTHRKLPPGTHVAGIRRPVSADSVAFVPDVTGADAYGRRFMDHAISDEVLRTVGAARRFVVLDYSRVGDGPSREAAAPLAGALCDALIARRRATGLAVLVITDPGDRAEPEPELVRLRAAGAAVVITDLARLRDANFLYSSLWRLTLSWWHPAPGRPDAPAGTLADFSAWAQLPNLTLNHRKVLIADDGHGGLAGVVSSADADGSHGADSNAALRIEGPALADLLGSELAVARFSGWQGSLDLPAESGGAPDPASAPAAAPASDPVPAPARAAVPAPAPANAMSAESADATVQVLTEGAIRAELLRRLEAATSGDAVDVAMFRLSDRAVIDALLAAARRNAAVRLILDPCKDGVSTARAGFPNQPVASELVSASDGRIRVAWYRTHGERFHTKLVLVRSAGRLWLLLGSADLTRRSLADYNLEADAALEAASTAPAAQQALQYFDTLWNDRGPPGVEYTADADTYADPSQLRYWVYRAMEATGLSAF